MSEKAPASSSVNQSRGVCTLPDNKKKLVALKVGFGNIIEIYHELKVLLTLPQSTLIMPEPLYLVMTGSSGAREDLVCGFVLEIIEKGTLDKYIPVATASGQFQLPDQIQFAKQLASAVLLVNSLPGMFISDLKTDNITVRDVHGYGTITLIDFEMNSNIFAWAAPEISLIHWLGELACSMRVEDSSQQYFADLLEDYLDRRGLSRTAYKYPLVYSNPPSGYYFPWLASNPEEREARNGILSRQSLLVPFWRSWRNR
jgi:hypothetical protein